jgi:chloride channel 3/4/5
LVVRFSPYAKQSGIPEIKTVLGGFVIRRFLGAWTLAVKSIGLCLAVASGMWLGKEGPLVHVACCCANLFMKLFPSINGNEARKREVLSAAAASGISVAFGSPIGGVLFSLEQLSYYFPDKTMWASFVCAMVAAVTLQAFDPFRTGKIVLYQVTYHSGWHAFELLPFAVIGILGGLYGGFFIKLNLAIASFRKSSRNPFHNRPILEVMAVALLTAAISFPVTFLRAQSSELVESLFSECKDIAEDELGLCKSGVANTGVLLLLLLSSLIGSLLASFTFGLQIPAGILLPSMAVGALFGRSIGLIVELAQQQHSKSIIFAACEPDIPCVTPGTYAVIGAAAALAGATRMTVSIVVIMFELTGALTYVLPIMIAVMLAKWTGDAIHSQGIYESWIQLNGYPYLDQTSQAPIPEVPISQLMTRADDLVNLTSVGHTIGSLRELLREHHFRGFPVVASHADQTLLGYISRTELNYALSRPDANLSDDTEAVFTHQPLGDSTNTVDLRPWMDQTPITLNEHASLMLTSEMFQKLGLRYILFVARGELKGFMTKKDLWLCLNEGAAERVGHEGGGLREHTEGEREDQRGLLGEEQP